MKKILFHSLTFPPDTISTGMIVSKIAEGFQKDLKNVEVLASSPQYNLKILEQFRESKHQIYNDIKVHYISSSPRKFVNSLRFLQWLSFNLKSLKFIYKNRKTYEHIFIFSYPPTMNLVCIFTSRILKIKTIYSLWELYPEIAQKLKEQPNFLLNKIFKAIDNYALNSVDSVVVNSKELKQYLITNRKIDRNKIFSVSHFSPFNKSNHIPNYDLKNIFYAGNVGKPQNLQDFINFFQQNFPNYWSIDLYGAGQELENVQKLTNINVRFHEYLSREELEVSTKDIPFALISLDYEITMEGFPGKTFDYLNMNKILINYSNPNSAVSKLIDEHGLGFNIDKNNPNTLKNFMDALSSEDAIDNVISNISKFQKNISNEEIVYKKYMSLISSSS
ncbi:MAG: hypothetical protein EBW04_03995 [Betaproteobacteria bacterium]|nr:hypothetical protein [Betaproteobacteria bacterium]